MDAEDQDLAERYAQMAEPDLQTIARDYDSLTDQAQAALRNEFGRRGLEAPLVEESEDVPSSRKLVTLRRYRDLSEAIVARSLLESAGIVVTSTTRTSSASTGSSQTSSEASGCR